MLAIIIGGSILLFGYKIISEMNEKADRAAFVKFKTTLTEDIESISYEPRSVKTEKYNIPSSFGRVCFVDLYNINDLSYLDAYPIIKDSVKSKTQANIFLIKENNIEPLYINGLQLNDPFFHCIEAGRTINVRMEGTGDGTIIQPPPAQEWCQNAETGGLCDGLDVVFGSGYKCRCWEEYNLCDNIGC